MVDLEESKRRKAELIAAFKELAALMPVSRQRRVSDEYPARFGDAEHRERFRRAADRCERALGEWFAMLRMAGR
jgi:hypothetical protein